MNITFRPARLARACTIAAVLIGVTIPLAPASGQSFSETAQSMRAKRDTLVKMMRPITIDFQDQRLEDVMTFIGEYTGADIEPLWMTDDESEGLDKDQIITLKVKNVTVLNLLERVLERSKTEFSEGGWQFTTWGTLEVGPKSRLNKHRRIEIYPIDDLLTVVPDYPDAPEIDLQQAIQSGRGGGGAQSPFRNTNQQNDPDTIPREERAQDLIDLLEELVEPDQWIDNGGDAASIRYYQGSLLVNAPDYVHRQLNGYSFWPARYTSTRMVKGRRYVSLDLDPSISTVDGFGQQPVSAVVGGRIERSDDPGGGG
jgi:hypothetical protein